jgi:hypothetical protein
MSSSVPVCRTITVFAFRGDHSRAFTARFRRALDDERNGCGPGPTPAECLFYTGHTGVSTDDGTSIYGFNPDGSVGPVWRSMDRLKNGEALPGVVRDDRGMFSAATQHGLPVLSFNIIFPDPQFQLFERSLDGERRKSQYSYGFPNGDGDCNCITWLERLGLPLLTGRMNELAGLPGISSDPRRRFGLCV